MCPSCSGSKHNLIYVLLCTMGRHGVIVAGQVIVVVLWGLEIQIKLNYGPIYFI